MSKWTRQLHRWLSIAFTLGFLINLVHAMTATGDEYPIWMGLIALGPLLLLLATGLYLFVHPYLRRVRADRT